MSINIYPFPKELAASELYKVFVNGEEIFVTDTQLCLNVLDYPSMERAPHIASYASFGADGGEIIDVRVELIGTKNISDAKILPGSAGVEYTARDGQIFFKISAGQKLCLYANGAENNMLMLFANDESLLPKVDTSDEGVIYFAPGVHQITENDGKLELFSNQTLYLAGGAYLFTRIEANGADNLRIMGPGVICGTRNEGRWDNRLRQIMGVRSKTPRHPLVKIRGCHNLQLDSVTLVDSPEWTLNIVDSENVNVRNVKILGCMPNSDGIDICSSRKVYISDCFFRNSDDGVVLKAPFGSGDVRDVLVERCTIWSDRASSLEIGHEIVNSNIENVVFSDIDILNCTEETYGYHALDITNVDNGSVNNILYENIRIERSARFVGIRIRESMYRSEASRGSGKVSNVTFRNISSNGGESIFIFGKDEEHKISNVTFENITLGGKPLLSLESVRHNKYVENITVKSGEETLAVLENYPEECECTPLDISAMTNMTFGHDSGVYGMCDKAFMDMPSEPTFDGIPFRITTQGYYALSDGEYKRGVIPQNRIRATNRAMLYCDIRANKLFFLETALNVYSQIDTVIARYVISYDDGESITVDVKNQNDCNDWKTWSLAGWNAIHKDIKLYVQVWKNPYPEKKIRSIEMLDGDIPELCVLFGITAA